MDMFGVTNSKGEYVDISQSLLGAKQYATRNNYRIVYCRHNSGYHLTIAAIKHLKKWHDVSKLDMYADDRTGSNFFIVPKIGALYF